MNFKKQLEYKYSKQKQIIDDVHKDISNSMVQWEDFSRLHKEIQDLLKERQLLINRRQQIEKIRTKIGR